MAFDTKLADRIRAYLIEIPGLEIEEKKMFRGLAFMVNGKMCVNVSGDRLMCRFDPKLHEVVAEKNGVEPMIMRGKELKGYCYVRADEFKAKRDFVYFVDLCLGFNKEAKSSKR